MSITSLTESQALRFARGTLELSSKRAITAGDAAQASMLAMQTATTGAISVIGLAWAVDGVTVDAPVGEFGSRLTATAQFVLGDSSGEHGGFQPDDE